jgi:ElaB/YqjD/DUF883 family membrane-anchored ribosome-binding protein
MASTADTLNDTAADARAQIKQLRDQVDALMRERVTPMLSEAAGRAQDAARQAQEIAQDQVDQLSGHVRETPITSVLIAAAVGFLIGRIAR